MPLWKRTYRCQNGGLVLDRDENSAVTHAPAVLCPAPVHTRAIPCGVRVCSPQLTSHHVEKGRVEQSRLPSMKHPTRFLVQRIPLSKALAWQRPGAAFIALAALLLNGCVVYTASSGMSDTGSPIVVSNQAQPVFAASNCTGTAAAIVQSGGNLIDLGAANSSCEQVAYPNETGYMQSGYVPVYSIHRATNSVQCFYQGGCNLRAGPSTSASIFYVLPFGQRVQGRATNSTGAIITDGNQYSWWEVVVPSTGQIADIYGSLSIAF
jgi:hypothetical protein